MSRLDRLYSPPEIGAPGKREAQDRRRDLFLAGLFVLAMLAVVIAVVMLLGPGLFGGYTLRAYFQEADGLERGIDVMQEGFVIGRVQAVEPVFRGDPDRGDCPQPTGPRAPDLPCFRATLGIQQGWPVPEGSTAQLAPAGVLQGNIIRIHPGVADQTLDPGSYIATIEREPDLGMQIAAALEKAQRTIDQTIRPTLESIQERIKGLLALVGGGEDGAPGVPTELGDGLAEVFANLKQITADLEQSIDPENISAILSSVEQLTDNLAALSGSFDARSDDVRDAVQTYTALARDLRGVVSSVEPDINASLNDAQHLLQELSAALTPILASIETASRNLAALTGDLRQDPKSLLFGGEEKEPSPWFER